MVRRQLIERRSRIGGLSTRRLGFERLCLDSSTKREEEGAGDPGGGREGGDRLCRHGRHLRRDGCASPYIAIPPDQVTG